MFGRVYCLWMRGGSYILRAIKCFWIFGIGNVQLRADKFDSLLSSGGELRDIGRKLRLASDSMSAKYVLWSNFVLV